MHGTFVRGSFMEIRALMLVLMFGLVGCAASAPGFFQYDGAVSDNTEEPDAMVKCDQHALMTVSFDNSPQTACSQQYFLKGVAKGAASVIAKVEASSSKPASVGPDGNFCIEMNLLANQLNTIEVTPIDVYGCPGTSQTFKVTQQACSQETQNFPRFNAAEGAEVTSSKEPRSFSAANLTDGQPSTVVEYEGGWGWQSAKIWVHIALKSAVELDEIVLHWKNKRPSGCDFGKKYRVVYSSLVHPGDPNEKDGPWYNLVTASEGEGGDESFSLDKRPMARHIAILLEQDACNFWSQTFSIGEVEVLGYSADQQVQFSGGGC